MNQHSAYPYLVVMGLESGPGIDPYLETTRQYSVTIGASFLKKGISRAKQEVENLPHQSVMGQCNSVPLLCQMMLVGPICPCVTPQQRDQLLEEKD